MANVPAAQTVVNVSTSKVFTLIAGSSLSAQDGADLGTGGPTPATAEVPNAATFINNRVAEFLGDRFALTADNLSASSGVYKRNQGGAGQWGRVQGGGSNLSQDSAITGLHVLHPNGVPTLALIRQDGGITLRLHSTTDGVTGANWLTSTGLQIESNVVANETDFGQGLVFGSSIVFAHEIRTGGAGVGSITQHDLATGVLTRYDVSTIYHTTLKASNFALHVHDGVIFLIGGGTDVAGKFRLSKLAGSFTQVWEAPTQYVDNAGVALALGHSAMFTDAASGDLIMILSGDTTGGGATEGATIWNVPNATGGSPTPVDISSTVFDSGEGADKYLAGGGSAHSNRRYSVSVDTTTDPAAPRTYITTWIPGGSTETWEWKGIAAEVELVNSGAGISDTNALPYNVVGGGHRTPRTFAAEFNPALFTEVVGGTNVAFNVHGTGAAGTLTTRGVDTQGAPDTIVPIVAASLNWGAGMLPGLIAYYHFDNTFTDFSGNGLDLSAASGTPAYVAGKIGNGVDFDSGDPAGTRLRILSGNAALQLGVSGAPFTVSVWVDHDTLNNAPICNYSNDSGTDGWSLRVLSSGVVRWLRGSTVLLDSSPGAITVGAFQHIMVVSGGTVAAGGTGVIEIFVDNVSVGSGTPLDHSGSGSSFHVGNDNPASLPMDGIVDELAFYDRGLNALDRGHIYNSGAGFLLEGDTPFASPPSISGNTIINLVPDEGRTPFTMTLDTGAAGVDISAGETGLLIPDMT